MANRKQWRHGFFTNTFNAETGNWQLTDNRTGELEAEGPKAAPLGKLGAAKTRCEKARSKVKELEAQLIKANKAFNQAHRIMTDLQLEIDLAAQDEDQPAAEDLQAETKKQLLDRAKALNIVGRHNLTKEELVNALSID